jgi:hypothetical protein
MHTQLSSLGIRHVLSPEEICQRQHPTGRVYVAWDNARTTRWKPWCAAGQLVLLCLLTYDPSTNHDGVQGCQVKFGSGIPCSQKY